MTALTRPIVVLVMACLALGTSSWVSPARAEGVAVHEATGAQKRAAQQQYDEAMKAFNDKRLDEALAGFRASYDIVASPNTRLMVVHVLEDLGDVVAAYLEAVATREAADAAAAQNKRYRPAAKSARKEVAKLRRRVGLVTVKVLPAEDDDGAGVEAFELTVAGQSIDRAAWGEPIAVAPGQCEVVLVAATGTATKEIGVAAGGAIAITIAPPGRRRTPDEPQGPSQPSDPVRPPEGGELPGGEGAGDDGSGLRAPAYVFGALGVAGMVVFAISGSMAQSNYDELVDQCPADRCPADLEDQADTTRTQQTVANVGLIAGAAGLGIGLGLLVTSFVVADSPDEADVSLAVGPGTLTVTGSF
ncbi:MAG: hypothetical protein JRI68_01150 [Deltaproteobacteria bacterium]|nr:hypothetical protein [Deltaproteobacteria bacterium]